MIVVDASVLIDALLDDGPAGNKARAALAEDPQWAAPGHLLAEVLSVTRRRVLRGDVEPGRATEAVDTLGKLEVLWVDPAALVPRVWALRDHVAAFDAAYVAAAELLGCALLTSDRHLAAATGPLCPVRTVG